MGLTAENVADKYNISREDQDGFGLRSNELAMAAIKEGRFAEQITPLEIHSRNRTRERNHQEEDRGSSRWMKVLDPPRWKDWPS